MMGTLFGLIALAIVIVISLIAIHIENRQKAMRRLA